MFERLDFVYLPSRDVAADVAHYVDGLGAELVFAIERFGTRVAMVRLSPEPPALLLAPHLEGDQPVLVHRVADLEAAIAELQGPRRRGRRALRDPVRTGDRVRAARPAAGWRSTR